MLTANRETQGTRGAVEMLRTTLNFSSLFTSALVLVWAVYGWVQAY